MKVRRSEAERQASRERRQHEKELVEAGHRAGREEALQQRGRDRAEKRARHAEQAARRSATTTSWRE